MSRAPATRALATDAEALLPAPCAAARARLQGLLQSCRELGASDLHLTAGEPPALRQLGRLAPIAGLQPLEAAETAALAASVLDPAQRRAFAAEGALDLALSLPRANAASDPASQPSRFRLNVFLERGQVALSVRRLDERVRSLVELHLPERLKELAELDEGLVLLVGPTGSGKSTTLAALIDRINQRRALHVVTLEDPIEYLHRSQRALIRQRQLHSDFPSFARALRATLREDPDVILVGEMRDRATMRAALAAAETGHLVFSTLHASGAAAAAERFVGAFAEAERDGVRQQLSLVLRAVVSQRLLPTRDGGGRAPATEVLRVTPAVANLIRTGKPAQVASAMESGASLGMQTLEQSLAWLAASGLVAEERAQALARDPAAFQEKLRLLRRAPAAARGGA
ncbi:MAG: type IV pilus twitching motility protein PilT [Planctomycetota bacterium]